MADQVNENNQKLSEEEDTQDEALLRETETFPSSSMSDDVFDDDFSSEVENEDLDAQISKEDFESARNTMHDAVDALTFDKNHMDSFDDLKHQSGVPQKRHLVFGSEDSRDSILEEKPLSEDTVWIGRIFDVNRLRVALPDGRTALRDVVRHPGAVAIVALTDEGRICLVRQYRTALGRVTVEVPAGKMDPGEDPLDCAHRELLEETGMQAEKMAFLTTLATSDGFCDELIHIYMATGLKFVGSDPDADEFINVDLVPVNELVDAVLDGKIEDAKTVVGALLCDSISHRLPLEQLYVSKLFSP